MSDHSLAVVVAIAVMALVTFGLRAVPFLAGQWIMRRPWARSLGQFLPLGIMALLTLHSATEAAVARGDWAAEALALAVSILLQRFLGNALLSIGSGALLYIAWINGWF